jgi:hypothetical protein
VPPELQVGIEPILDGGEPPFLQAVGDADGKGPVGELEERGASPERLALDERGAGRLRFALEQRLVALVGEGFEAPEVDAVDRCVEPVAGRLEVQRDLALAEGAPQAADVALEGAEGRERWVLAPDRVDQGVRRNDPADGGQQDAETMRAWAPRMSTGVPSSSMTSSVPRSPSLIPPMPGASVPDRHGAFGRRGK